MLRDSKHSVTFCLCARGKTAAVLYTVQESVCQLTYGEKLHVPLHMQAETAPVWNPLPYLIDAAHDTGQLHVPRVELIVSCCNFPNVLLILYYTDGICIYVGL